MNKFILTLAIFALSVPALTAAHAEEEATSPPQQQAPEQPADNMEAMHSDMMGGGDVVPDKEDVGGGDVVPHSDKDSNPVE